MKSKNKHTPMYVVQLWPLNLKILIFYSLTNIFNKITCESSKNFVILKLVWLLNNIIANIIMTNKIVINKLFILSKLELLRYYQT